MIRRLLVALALLGFAALPARADDSRPLYVSIEVDDAGALSAEWKLPDRYPAAMLPQLRAPAVCSRSGQSTRWNDASGHWQSQRWSCSAGGAGQTIEIDWPDGAPGVAAVVRMRTGDNGERTQLLLPGQTQIEIAQAEARRTSKLLDYIRLGVEHIWLGFDHLLFIAALIFIARTPRRILATITGFTLSHSVTLALSALDIVRLPVRAVEATIALSIIFLAVEIVRNDRSTLTWRYPVGVAASFGLLHGFGFAAVLREVGLPQDNFVPALLGFNVGIEIGQILFATCLVAIFALARRLTRGATFASRPLFGQRLAAYPVGILASFWMFERLFA